MRTSAVSARLRVASPASMLGSTAMTLAPRRASSTARLPSPQPSSSTRLRSTSPSSRASTKSSATPRTLVRPGLGAVRPAPGRAAPTARARDGCRDRPGVRTPVPRLPTVGARQAPTLDARGPRYRLRARPSRRAARPGGRPRQPLRRVRRAPRAAARGAQRRREGRQAVPRLQEPEALLRVVRLRRPAPRRERSGAVPARRAEEALEAARRVRPLRRRGLHRLLLEPPRPARAARPQGRLTARVQAAPSATAGGYRPARCAGTSDTSSAPTTATAAIATITSVGTLAIGATPSSSAKRVHAHRPATTPIGTPSTSPTATVVNACHRTLWPTWPAVYPSDRWIAYSRRRAATVAP